MRTHKLVQLGLLVAMAGTLHWLEGLLPVPLPVPGFKLGLANIITLYVLVVYGLTDALLVCAARALLGTMLAGLLLGLPFALSLTGAITACLMMHVTMKLTKSLFSLAGVSVLGAVAHNFAQLIMAAYVVSSPDLLYYLPYILLFAIPTGLVTGITTIRIMSRPPN